jgi:hypothetical protein
MVETPNGPQLDPALATYKVCDDSKTMRAICDRLALEPERLMAEKQLKKELGFKNTAGHREWRKVRGRLENGGFVEAFLARSSQDQKALSCVRLLKEFRPDDAKKDKGGRGGAAAFALDEEGEEPDVLEGEVAPRSPSPPPLPVPLSL